MASSSSSSCIYSNPPCAACKFLRRKCLPGCTFAPYFPPEEPTKFASVHKVFGASNVSKLLNEIPPHQREDAVNSLAYEADARLRDPVYGCVGAISVLQRQVAQLQKELDATNAELMRYTRSDKKAFTGDHEVVLHGDDDEEDEDGRRRKIRINNGFEYGGRGSFDPSLGVFGISYSWNND